MNEMSLYALNVILNFIEIVALYLFSDCFFQCKISRKRLWISFVALLTINVLIYLVADHLILFLKLILLTGAATIWLVYVFQSHILKSLVTAVFFVSLSTVADSIFVIGIAAITDQSVNGQLQNPYVYYLLCYTAKLVELLAILVFKLCLRGKGRSEMATWQDWLRTILFPVISVVIALSFLRIIAADTEAAPLLLFCTVVLILADILAITLLNYLEKQQRKLHDYAILKHSIKREQDNIAAWMNAYSNQRKQTHDFQNRLSAIRGLIQQEAPNGALSQYVDQLLQTDFTDSLFVKTGRPIVDAVLNQKYSLAQSKKIVLQVQLDDLRSFALPDDALVVVLSNLIDNAIEACEKISDENRRIVRLIMQADPEVNFIHIENPTSIPVRIVNNRVASSKKHPLEHGYGLQNITAILDQYEAIYDFNYDDNTKIFRFSAQIIPPNK